MGTGHEPAITCCSSIYNKIIRDGLAYHETLPPLPCKGKQGRQPRRTGHNLLLRLFHYKQDVLRFLYDPAVPFTIARIRGFISTIRKQGLSIISSIQSIFSGTIPVLSGI